MNFDQLEGKWKQYKGQIREKWGKLTEDDLQVIGGKRDQFIGRLQERYGFAREVAAKQVDEFVKSMNDEFAETPEERAKAERHAAGKH
jgi:uncharacterized protein YjbJ (UPF0337 family)